MPPQEGPLAQRNEDNRQTPERKPRRVTIIALWAVTLSALLAGLATFALVACKSGP